MKDRRAYHREYNRLHPEKHRLASLKYEQVHKDKVVNRKLLSKYGITLQEKTEMFKSQNGQCKICSLPFETLYTAHVDHNHLTGKVRGLLCLSCNHMVGKARDSIVILQKAIDYLR